MGPRKRTIVIGDVHGCSTELKDLLAAVEASPQDDLISVGDLIAKGPNSAGVLDWAMKTENLRCVRGNHEERFLHEWKAGSVPASKPYDRATVEQLRPRFERYMEFLSTCPYFIEGEGFTVLHGGLNPAISKLQEQDPEDLVNLRCIDGEPWYDSYSSDRLIVFGHWAKQDLVVRPNAIGLDTGCVYGGALSAVILPERRVVSVPARQIYWNKKWTAAP